MPAQLFHKGQIPWNKGISTSEEIREKISNTLKKKGIKPKVRYDASGESNRLWKGDEVGYSGLHYWVYRKLGKPKICEFCGEDKRKLTWANKSHKYKRDVLDWLSLCYSCHKIYDLKTR